MEDLINKWLFDPVVGKAITSGLVVVIVVVLVRYVQRALGQRIEDSQRRYRLRKLITIGGYVVALVSLSVVYSDKLSGLTVMFGVLGAGIAFALQEVIVSVASSAAANRADWSAPAVSVARSPASRATRPTLHGDSDAGRSNNAHPNRG